MKSLPNILTGLRLVLSLTVFLALLWAGGALPVVDAPPVRMGNSLILFSFVAFVVAAVTDFFDGWLARKYGAVTITGAILDPIADKILVCGALLGLLALGAKELALPAGLILFREFAVSALREVLAPRGIKLPVTFLAKTKTTLQLLAIAAILGLPIMASEIASSGRAADIQLVRNLMLGAVSLMWIAALVTVWTGIDYAMAAAKAFKSASGKDDVVANR